MRTHWLANQAGDWLYNWTQRAPAHVLARWVYGSSAAVVVGLAVWILL